jgi:hypothetical protein
VDARKAGIDAVFSSAVGGEFSDSEVRRFCFFVTRSRQFLTEPAWLHLSGCHYFLPKLCAVPAFRPVLEVLFSHLLAENPDAPQKQSMGASEAA